MINYRWIEIDACSGFGLWCRWVGLVLFAVILPVLVLPLLFACVLQAMTAMTATARFAAERGLASGARRRPAPRSPPLA